MSSSVENVLFIRFSLTETAVPNSTERAASKDEHGAYY